MAEELDKPEARPLEKLSLGLDRSYLLAAGGWLNASAKMDNNTPLTINLDAGARLTPNWVAYGEAWAQPTVGTFGGVGGLRYKSALDLYVEGEGNLRGDYSLTSGLRWHF